MIIYKEINIDMEAERKRVDKCKYTKKQKNALIKLYNLFEQGKWKECLIHVNDGKAFPDNKKHEYPEVEHIGIEIVDILMELDRYRFLTEDQITMN